MFTLPVSSVSHRNFVQIVPALIFVGESLVGSLDFQMTPSKRREGFTIGKRSPDVLPNQQSNETKLSLPSDKLLLLKGMFIAALHFLESHDTMSSQSSASMYQFSNSLALA